MNAIFQLISREALTIQLPVTTTYISIATATGPKRNF